MKEWLLAFIAASAVVWLVVWSAYIFMSIYYGKL